MSRNHPRDEYEELMASIAYRYKRAREGYVYDFEEEIEPFLESGKKLAENILQFKTDVRFDASSREKVYEELMELLMSCHIKRFSRTAYHEKYKFINTWLNHARREGLM